MLLLSARPHQRPTDKQRVWIGDKVMYISDVGRSGVVFRYEVDPEYAMEVFCEWGQERPLAEGITVVPIERGHRDNVKYGIKAPKEVSIQREKVRERYEH